MWQLVAARGIQGLGAGAIFPLAMATIADLFSPSERGRYQGLFGAVFGMSSLIGPAIGGLITDTIGWPFVFFVNIPIGLVVLFTIRRYLPAYHLGGDKPKIDYLGAALFTGALVPILIGLTNKQSADWTDLTVGGLILLGVLVLGAFVWIESRAAEPIVPLELFRTRAFAVSVGSVFLAMFGFFAAVVFLPRWFQVVGGSSATVSGYQMLPLLGGLIVSAVASGQLVARTGRYRWLVFAALITTAAGLAMLTQLRADTPLPLLWLAMLVTGIGVGPTFAVFPLVVQNSVPVRQIGSAVSNLSFFQQIGGTVGLAITGTVFATSLTREIPSALVSAGVPPQVGGALASGGGGAQNLTGVGDMGAAILASLPAEAQAAVAPFIPAIVGAIHQAFSIATASTFAIGIATSLGAAALVLLFREAPATAEAARAGRGRAANADGQGPGAPPPDGQRQLPAGFRGIRRRVSYGMPGASVCPAARAQNTTTRAWSGSSC